MQLDTRLQQRMDQRMALLPQMLQSIEVLQLATVDLLARIDRELQQNVTLEVRDQAPAPPELQRPLPKEPRGDDAGPWEPRRPAGDGDDRKLALFANLPARGEPLVEHVRGQLLFRRLPRELTQAVLLLAEHLDQRGLLPFTAEQLQQMTGLDQDLLAAALDELQALEPKGLGAATPIEAMLLQLGDDPDRDDLQRLLTAHLHALAHNRIPDVARAMGLEVADVQELLARLRLLSPRPAASITDQVAEAIHPDACVWLDGGELHVALADGVVPELSVSRHYQRLLDDRGTPREVKRWLQPQVRAARDLIGAVQQRQATLLRVVAAVMQHQRDFLANGRAGIRPLRMRDLAERLALHTSTVSRAIAGKYVQTDQGVVALRDFFDGGSDDGDRRGRAAVRQTIAELIAGEDKSMPWSDDDLVAELRRRGIQVARRTVTKYRLELGLGSSFQRKRHGDRA